MTISSRRTFRATLLLTAVVFLSATEAPGADPKYMGDFEFLRKTVAENYAALEMKKIDWPHICARFKPLFAACTSDVEHVKNCMMMLATLRDSHTGVWRTSVKGLPSKWDGLYGGGLWIGWDRGCLVLMGLMEGHPLSGSIPLGSVIATIDGEPAWLALERERRRITKYAGSSSDHSLFSSMDNRLLPFGDKQAIEVLFLTPEGKPKKATVRRWGPGGKAFYPGSDLLPEGVEWQEGAVSAFLPSKWCEKLGYLRITGSMDAATVTAFHAAFDRLKGMEALILDCRGMGGGGDDKAWEMAGRFYPHGVDNGLNGRIEASGSWQFDGPVVMLQDEKEVSSAETFTWAMSETGRVVSVGRPTGGWGIIPHIYSAPSSLFSFRLGVSARPTPIKRVQTEGIGWPADVEIPYGPVVRAIADPVFDVGVDVLRILHAGGDAAATAALFGGLFRGEIKEFDKGVDKLAEIRGWSARPLARLAKEDLEGRLKLEIALLSLEEAGPPDVLGAARREQDLEDRASAAGLKSLAQRFKKTLKKLKAERAAQEAFLELADDRLVVPEGERRGFLRKHKRTALARYLGTQVWK